MGVAERWLDGLSHPARQRYARVAYVLGFICSGLAGWLFLMLLRSHVSWLASSTQKVEGAVAEVERATVKVHAEIKLMAAETAKAQKLAIWVGVGTAVLGALIGGFAGAFAARLLG